MKYTLRFGRDHCEYKIIVDSCGELTHRMKNSGVYETASLSMEVDGDVIVDDESFDQADFLRRVAASPDVRNLRARPLKNIWNCTAGVKRGCMRLHFLRN